MFGLKTVTKEKFFDMNFQFYLDLTYSVLLKFQKGDVPPDEYWQIKIHFIRVTLGCIFNIATLIVICVLNRTNYVNSSSAVVLFTFLIIHLVWMYTTSFCVGVAANKDIFTIYIFHANYKLLDMLFDLYIIVYSLVLKDWQMTDIIITVTVIFCTDILYNLVLYIIAIRIIYKDEKRSIIKTIASSFSPIALILMFFCSLAINNHGNGC